MKELHEALETAVDEADTLAADKYEAVGKLANELSILSYETGILVGACLMSAIIGWGEALKARDELRYAEEYVAQLKALVPEAFDEEPETFAELGAREFNRR